MKVLTFYILALTMVGISAKPFIFDALKNFGDKIKNSVRHFIGDKSERADGKPWFCHELDCPQFKKVHDYTYMGENIEERCYPQTEWVRTEGTAEHGTKFRTLFHKLFDYIEGDNADETKIPMTAPVLVSVNEDANKMQMNFYVPPSNATLPAPKASDVTIATQDAMCVYVLSYGGWQMKLDDELTSKVNELKSGLAANGLEFDESAGYMYAGYDSPFRIINRHNEVMLVKKRDTKEPTVAEN